MSKLDEQLQRSNQVLISVAGALLKAVELRSQYPEAIVVIGARSLAPAEAGHFIHQRLRHDSANGIGYGDCPDLAARLRIFAPGGHASGESMHPIGRTGTRGGVAIWHFL
jgi:hypothetical protein